MCFGHQFVWVTDCYAVKFILSDDGSNSAILQLQMCLMCWDVDIVHQANNFLVDADYWSCLNADLCYNPTFRKYLQFVSSFHAMHPPPTDLPMQPKNMPYYQGPCIRHLANSGETTVNAAASSLLTTIITQERNSSPCLANYPIQLGKFLSLKDTSICPIYNSNFQPFLFVWLVSIGLCICSIWAILPPRHPGAIYHSTFCWLAVHMHMGMRYLMNSWNADVFCQARLLLWTTFPDQETTVFSMGI